MHKIKTLEQELGPAAHATLMQAMQRIGTLAATGQAEVDSWLLSKARQLQPWLLEVNSTPSLAAEHESEAADPSSLSSNSTPSSLMDHTSSAPGLGALTNLTLSDQEELQQQPGQQEQGDNQLHEFVQRFSSASELQTQQ
ncbi:hypothetical protein HaLaN_21467, partial [Haematococcus lacustris]